MILFNGKQFAKEREAQLVARIELLNRKYHKLPKIGCLLFSEDQGGVIYTQEKKTVAERLGIGYEVIKISMTLDLTKILDVIQKFNQDSTVSGIIIQKPWKKTWATFQDPEHQDTASFTTWWHTITSVIEPNKDVDGLHPLTIQSIESGTWQKEGKVLPATCRAVISILKQAETELGQQFKQQKTLVLGRSELLGQPLFFELKHRGWKDVSLAGQQEFATLKNENKIRDFQIIISSTGIKNVISGDLLAENCIVIDAGFPKADVDFESASKKAAFLTPVPNGVGPVTVISLLENAVDLCYN